MNAFQENDEKLWLVFDQEVICLHFIFQHSERQSLSVEMLGLSVSSLLDHSVALANFNNHAFNYWVFRGG